jgi:nucleoside-diphosphate-sugar epimerase
LLGKNISPVYAEHRNGDIKHSFADISLIQKNLNWTPKYSFIEGLKILTTNN